MMASLKARAVVAGSEKEMLRRAKPVGRVDPEQRIEITILLRSRARAASTHTLEKRVMELGRQLPRQRQYLSREDLAALPTAGFINPLLYRNPKTFRDVVAGNNDIDGTLHKYEAGPGWDACTGLDSPIGTRLMNALGG